MIKQHFCNNRILLFTIMFILAVNLKPHVMAQNHLHTLFLLLFLAFIFSSCDKSEEVDIAQLEGTWYVIYDEPNLEVDGGEEYTFDRDYTCSKYLSSYLVQWDTTIQYTYMLSYDHRILTLFDENKIYAEQWEITKLNAKEMHWKASSTSIKTNVKLARRPDQ